MSQSVAFQKYYPLLYTIAARMVNSKEAAEDLVQDTFLRWLKSDPSSIQNHKAYLVQSVKNACLNYLAELKRKKETLFESIPDTLSDYQQNLSLAFSDWETEMSAKLAEMMQKLNPKEQAVFILRDSFNMSFEEVGELVDSKIENARKTFQRAKERMQHSKPRFSFDWEAHKAKLPAFIKAHQNGELSNYLMNLKDEANQWLSKKKSSLSAPKK